MLQISVFGGYYVNQVSTLGDVNGSYLENIVFLYDSQKHTEFVYGWVSCVAEYRKVLQRVLYIKNTAYFVHKKQLVRRKNT